MHILFTRPLDDSLTIIKKFKDLGHDVSHMPLLRIEKIETNNFDFYNYNALIFSSSNSIKFFKIFKTYSRAKIQHNFAH